MKTMNTVRAQFLAAWRDVRQAMKEGDDAGVELPLSEAAARCLVERQRRSQPIAQRLLWRKCRA